MKVIVIVLALLFGVESSFPYGPFWAHRKLGNTKQQQCQYPKDYTRTTPIIDTQDPLILEAVQSVLKSVSNAVNVTGQHQTAVSLAIVYNQTVLWSGGFGTMDYLDPLAPEPDGDTLYKIASQTKMFTALMLLMLRDAKLVNLEDSVMEKFHKFRFAADPFGTNQDITFKQLATQLSGLPRESPCGIFNPDPSCNETGPVWDLLAQILLPIWPPNTLPSYSNLAFSILGRSLAALAGTVYEKWVEVNILQPLGMTSSGFLITDDIAKRMPTTQGPYSQPWAKQTSLGWSNPAGQMYSSVNDMSKFIKKIFSDNNTGGIRRRTVAEALSPTFNNFDGIGGFGMPFEMEYWNNLWIMGKGGDIPGFDSMTVFIKELKIGITLESASAFGNPFPVTDVIYSAVTSLVDAVKMVLAKAQQREVYPPPQDQLDNILGCYFLEDPVLGSNTTLFVTSPGENEELEVSSPEILFSIRLAFRGCIGSTCTFQMSMLPGTCYVGEIQAWQGQYVTFGYDGIDRVLRLPTLMGNDDNSTFWKTRCL